MCVLVYLVVCMVKECNKNILERPYGFKYAAE